MTSTEKLLRGLIALPSVNPAFAPPGPRTGERAVAEFLAAVGARAGLDIEFMPALGERDNLIARLTPRGPVQRRILLAPHLDTVPGEDAQFTPVTKAGRLHGRGACDTKGAVAAMFSALCELAHGARRPAHTEVIFAGLVDEEHGQAGSRALVKAGVQADLAIVGEPTRLGVITAHKGNVWLRLTTTGKAAHGATPHLGRNAILPMVPVVTALENDYRAELARRAHPLLGSPTVNVGSIHAGAQPNIVPDTCVIEVDRRTLPGESEAGVLREITALLRARKLKAEVGSLKTAPCPALETNAEQPLVREFLRAAGQKRPLGAHYFCDAAVLAGGGMPSVVFGPGDIAQAHTADEWVELEQVEQARRLLVEFLHAQP